MNLQNNSSRQLKVHINRKEIEFNLHFRYHKYLYVSLTIKKLKLFVI